MGWNGTRLKTSWLRLRGAKSVTPYWYRPFFCDGCQRNHGPRVERNKTLEGRMLCNRQYYKELKTRGLKPKKKQKTSPLALEMPEIDNKEPKLF